MSAKCDLCGTELSAGAKMVSPQEMRIIAGNGYGVHVALWSSLSPEERKRKLYQIAITDDTTWAVCPDCYRGTRGYAEDQGEGPSHEDFRQFALAPLLEVMRAADPDAKHQYAPPPSAEAESRSDAASSGGRTLAGHTERVMCVSITPDGRRVLTSSWDQTVRLWDAETGAEIRCFKGHSGFICACAFLGDGRRAVSAGAGDNALRVWDCEDGREILRLRKHSFTIHQLSVSRDGRWALSASGDCTARVWDLQNGAHVRKLGGFFGGTHAEAVTSVALSPDGALALTGSLGAEVKLWDAATNRVLQTFKGFPYGINHLAFLPDGQRALAVPGQEPRVLDLKSGRDEGRFPSGLKSWDALQFSADGRRVVVGEFYDGLFVRILDAGTGRQIRSFEGHSKRISSVAISADGHRVVSGSDDYTACVWDV